MRSRRSLFFTWLVWAVLVLAADQLTKVWALRNLVEGERHSLIGDALGLQLLFNPGAAFSFGVGTTAVFTVISTIVVIGLPFYTLKSTSRVWVSVLAVVWGGAAGNLVDRLFRQPSFGRGHVVDFIAYGNWFIGNVADIALVAGIAVVAILTLAGVAFTVDPGDEAGGEFGGEIEGTGERADDPQNTDVEEDGPQNTALEEASAPDMTGLPHIEPGTSDDSPILGEGTDA